MTHHTERPDFPEDGMTADERRAMREYPPHHAPSVKRSPYNDGEPVAATVGNFLAMLVGALVIIAVGGGLYLEFAALAH